MQKLLRVMRRSPPWTWLKQERGASLLETTVAVGLVGAVMVIFLSALITHSIATRSVDGNGQAITLVRTQLEDIKNASYQGSYSRTVTLPSPEYSVIIGVVPVQLRLQRITVSVSRSGQVLLSVEMYKADLS